MGTTIPTSGGTLTKAFRLLHGLLRRHKRVFFIAVGGSAAVYAACTVFSSVVIQLITDELIVPRFEEGHVDTEVVVAVLCLLIGVGLVRAAGIVVRRIWASRTTWQVTDSITGEVIDRVVTQPVPWHRRQSTGDLITRAGVDAEAATAMLGPLPYATSVIVMIVLSSIWLMATDWLLGLAAVAVFPLSITLNVVYQRHVDRYFDAAQDELGRLSSAVHESFDGVTVVKSFGAERRETLRLSEIAARLRHERTGAVRIRATFESLLDGIPSVTNVLLLIGGAYRVRAGEMTVGEVASFIFLFTLLVFPLRLIGFALSELPHSLAGWNRIRELLDQPVEADPSANRVRGATNEVRLAGVDYHYEGARPVLSGVSAVVPAGRTVAVVGATGAGKTTLLNLVAGLIAPDRGTITVPAGETLLVLQEPFLLAGTARENITMGLDVDEATVASALSVAEATFLVQLPNGLDTEVGERGVGLSGGQRQRLALARALVRRPAVLLLDDTTSALDPTTEAKVLANLRRSLAGTTVVAVVRRPSTIALADDVLFLEDGTVVAHGRHLELLAAVAGYRALIEAFEHDRAHLDDGEVARFMSDMDTTVVGEPMTHWTAVHTIGRGVQEAPALRTGFGVTLALAMVGAGGHVAIPILVQQAIDRGFKPAGVQVDVIIQLAMIALVMVILATVCQRAAVARLGMRSEEALYTFRVRLFEHIHRLSIADHNGERKGALVARVTSDVETLAQFFSWGGLAWLLDGTLMITVAAVMLAYDWILALVALATAAPLAIVLNRMQRKLSKAYDEAREHNAEVLTDVTEVIAGAETLRAYGAGEHYAALTKRASGRRSDSFIHAGQIGAFLFPSGEVFSVFTVAAVVVVGLVRGPASGLTSGAMVGFVFLTYKFLEPIAEFTEVLDQTQTAVAGLRRVIGVLEIPTGPPEATHPVALPSGALDLTLDRVDFTYASRDGGDDEPPVLFGVSAHIPAGQQVAVVGETGSGKTTLGRLVARLADPTAGAVLVGGVPLTRVANEALRERLVVVPQEPFLFEGTVAANLSFARPALSYADLERAVADLDLDDWVDTLQDGLDTEVGQRGASLSAGERQLVALVRASLVDPDVLVLDEATSSVDALTEVRIARALDKLAEGRTTIAIAHRLSTAARADRVLVLDHGHLVEDGHHATLLAAEGVYARMYDAWLSATSAGRAS